MNDRSRTPNGPSVGSVDDYREIPRRNGGAAYEPGAAHGPNGNGANGHHFADENLDGIIDYDATLPDSGLQALSRRLVYGADADSDLAVDPIVLISSGALILALFWRFWAWSCKPQNGIPISLVCWALVALALWWR